MKEPTRVTNHSAAAIEEKFVEAAELSEDERAFKSEKPLRKKIGWSSRIETSKLTPVINHIEAYCEEIFTQAVELSKQEEAYKGVSHFNLEEYITHLS